jgi:hypothetical protein
LRRKIAQFKARIAREPAIAKIRNAEMGDLAP